MILLSGGTGFLGGHVLRALVHAGYEVTLLKRSSSILSPAVAKLVHASFDLDRGGLAAAVASGPYAAVVHLACDYGHPGQAPDATRAANLELGQRLFQAATDRGIQHFLNMDTVAPPAHSPYAEAKAAFRRWLQDQSHGPGVSSLRIDFLYGPGDSARKLLPWVLAQLHAHSSEIALSPGAQIRDFLYVTDAASAIVRLLRVPPSPGEFRAYPVASGEAYALKDALLALKRVFERRYGSSATRLNFGARPYHSGEPWLLDLDSQALAALGWSPRVRLEEGLTKLLGD